MTYRNIRTKTDQTLNFSLGNMQHSPTLLSLENICKRDIKLFIFEFILLFKFKLHIYRTFFSLCMYMLVCFVNWSGPPTEFRPIFRPYSQQSIKLTSAFSDWPAVTEQQQQQRRHTTNHHYHRSDDRDGGQRGRFWIDAHKQKNISQ